MDRGARAGAVQIEFGRLSILIVLFPAAILSGGKKKKFRILANAGVIMMDKHEATVMVA